MKLRKLAKFGLALALAGCGGAQPRAQQQCRSLHAVVRSQDDIAALVRCEELASLSVSGAASFDLRALQVKTIHGRLQIGPTFALSSIALPQLAKADAIVVTGNLAVTGLFLAQLTQANQVEFRDNGSLATVSLPRLERVEKRFALLRNFALETVLASRLTYAGELELTDNPGLTVVATAVPSEKVTVQGSPKLAPDPQKSPENLQP